MLIAFNKPFGVLCQFSGESPTLADYVDVSGVYPAGRLDKDSEGLLLLTDDGKLQGRIASPKFKLPKTYRVLVEREPDDAALETLRRGVDLKDGGLTSPKACGRAIRRCAIARTWSTSGWRSCYSRDATARSGA